MMMPGDPVPNLVIGQPRLSLSSFKTFLDPVLRLGYPCQLRKRRLWVGIGQIIIKLVRGVGLKFALTNSNSSGPVPPVGVLA